MKIAAGSRFIAIHYPAQVGSEAQAQNLIRQHGKETVMKRIMYPIAAAVLCAPLMAQAIEGWVIDDISLQAGPDPAYPSIVELNAGTPVSIQGCIDGWTWCDVIANADRGWVPGTFLEEDYGGQRVVVIDYGPQIAIPVVTFSLGVYWDQHYHNRPFYTQRQQWVTKAIQPSHPRRPAKAIAGATPRAPMTTPQAQQQKSATTQQAPARTTQQPRASKPAMTAKAAPPKRHEATPEPEAGKQPSQAEKRESAPAATNVAKAKPRAGEPKPKDELKQPKSKDDKRDQGGSNDGGH
jgi:uncharacterized protein YraI